MKEGLRFDSISIENFKNITSKKVEINGQSLFIIGGNGKGKSSFCQALLSPLDAKLVPTKPIKEGEERATIELIMSGLIHGEEKKYFVDLYFTPDNGRGRLVVRNEKGDTIKSPSTTLKSILGQITFDIFQFLNQSKNDKIATLKKLTGKGKEIDLLTMDIKEKKDKLKALKDNIEGKESQLKNIQFSKEEVEKYAEPIDIAPLHQKLANVSQAIENYNKVKSGVDYRTSQIMVLNNQIKNSESRIDQLKLQISEEIDKITTNQQTIESYDAEIKKGQAWLDKATEPNPQAISEEITNASLHNENNRKINELAEKQREIINGKKDLQTKKIELQSVETKRKKIIEDSQLPVEGLTFTEDDILINDLPLEDGQINTAKLIDVGVEIAMALNPTLRCIFIKDGSLLDNDTLKTVLGKCEERGYQIIVEKVSENGDELDIKFIESEVS